MSLHHRIRAIAGAIVLASLALAHWVDARFIWLTAFVGANLLQSAFTRWCLMEDIMRSTGLDGPPNFLAKLASKLDRKTVQVDRRRNDSI